MALTYMLDTNLLIELLRGKADYLVPRLEAAAGQLAVSTITVAELDYGVERSRMREAMRADVESLLELLSVVAFDRAAARVAGEIRHALASADTSIGPYDVLIAAHARALGLTLVTHNTRESARIPGLTIEDWQA